MASKGLAQINDLTNSPLRKKFIEKEFVPTTNIAVGMGRVSIKKNKDSGNSDIAQLQTIQGYCDREHLNLIKVWDVAETAAHHEKRKRFFEMIEFVKTNPTVRHVIFSHQSRSNRNRESAREIEALVRAGICVHFARDNRKLTCVSELEDWLLWDVYNNLNEKFITDLRKNVMDGMIIRIESGLFPGRAPFGYRNRKYDDGVNGFVVKSDETACVRRAYELFSLGCMSIPVLLIQLHQEFPELRGKLNTKRMSEMFRNPFYYGDFTWDGCTYKGNPAYHSPILGFDLWKKVQDVMDRPYRSRRKVTSRNHPYIGLVKCGGKILDAMGHETDEICGCSITGEEKRKIQKNGVERRYYYWHCSATARLCSQKNMVFMKNQGLSTNLKEVELEEILSSVFARLQLLPDVREQMKSILLKEHDENKAEHKQRLAALRRRDEMLDQYMNAAYEDKLKGLITEQMWREKHDRWMLEREEIQKEIKAAGEIKDTYIQRGVEIIELTQNLDSIYKNATPEKKRRLVEIVSSNLVLRNGSLEFSYRKPFDVLAEPTIEARWRTRQGSNLQPPHP